MSKIKNFPNLIEIVNFNYIKLILIFSPFKEPDFKSTKAVSILNLLFSKSWIIASLTKMNSLSK